MGPYGPIWNHIMDLLLVHMIPIWSPYGTIWTHMGPYLVHMGGKVQLSPPKIYPQTLSGDVHLAGCCDDLGWAMYYIIIRGHVYNIPHLSLSS